MIRYIFPFLLFLLLSGCSLKKADVDFDPNFKTRQLKTFSILYKNKEGYYGLNERRIHDALIHEIESKGYQKASKEEADFYMTFLVQTKEKVQPDISFGFGVGTFSRRNFIALGTEPDLIYDETTLFINSVDSKTQKVFWSSSLVVDSLESKTPQERIEYINKVVTIMLKEFPNYLNQEKK